MWFGNGFTFKITTIVSLNEYESAKYIDIHERNVMVQTWLETGVAKVRIWTDSVNENLLNRIVTNSIAEKRTVEK